MMTLEPACKTTKHDIPVRIRRGKWMVVTEYSRLYRGELCHRSYACSIVPSDENPSLVAIDSRPGESARDLCLRVLQTGQAVWWTNEQDARLVCILGEASA